MRSMMVILVAAGTVAVWHAPATAAPRGGPRPTVAATRPSAALQPAPPRAQHLTFDDDVVRARRDLGDDDVLGEPLPAKHSSLVKPRQDFIPELIKSADDI